jgi:hypothetical protein
MVSYASPSRITQRVFLFIDVFKDPVGIIQENDFTVSKTSKPRGVYLVDKSGKSPIFSIVGFLVDYELPPVMR